MLSEREGIVEFFEDKLHDALDLALLLRGKMIEVGLHRLISSKQPRSLHLPSA